MERFIRKKDAEMVRVRYAELIQNLGLSSGEADAFVNLKVKSLESKKRLLATCTSKVGDDRQAAAAMALVASEKADGALYDDIRRLLGVPAVGELVAIENKWRAGNIAHEYFADLDRDGVGLDSDAKEQVAASMAHTWFGENGTFLRHLNEEAVISGEGCRLSGKQAHAIRRIYAKYAKLYLLGDSLSH